MDRYSPHLVFLFGPATILLLCLFHLLMFIRAQLFVDSLAEIANQRPVLLDPDFADGNNTVAETQGWGWAAPGSHEGLWLALLVLGSAKHLPAASFERCLCHAFSPSRLGD